MNDTNITTISPNEYTTLYRLECRNTQITGFSANDSTLEYVDISGNTLLTQGNPYLKLMDLTNAIVLADGKVLDGSGTSSGSLTVIVTGTTLTEGSFPNWDNSYMTLVNEG